MIVESLNGVISCSSSRDRGTEFSVTLPIMAKLIPQVQNKIPLTILSKKSHELKFKIDIPRFNGGRSQRDLKQGQGSKDQSRGRSPSQQPNANNSLNMSMRMVPNTRLSSGSSDKNQINSGQSSSGEAPAIKVINDPILAKVKNPKSGKRRAKKKRGSIQKSKFCNQSLLDLSDVHSSENDE